jgi:hypothetical protein
MSGIIWLASYPKSGNTWIRAFLVNLLANPPEPVDINAMSGMTFGDARADFYEAVAGKPLDELDDEALHELRPAVHRLIASQKPDDVFVKTHNASLSVGGVPLITEEVTKGAIYIIRNPLDVTVSYADHYGITIDETIEAMASEVNHVFTVGRSVFQYISSWSEHVLSWTEAEGLMRLVVRYEDMTRKPQDTFGRVVRFLGLPKDPRRLKKAIRFASFKSLAKLERETGFIERSKNTKRFFRKGQIGDWRNVLSEAQVRAVVEAQGPVMRKFGYLSEDGRVRS